jgi:hypothetical protein
MDGLPQSIRLETKKVIIHPLRAQRAPAPSVLTFTHKFIGARIVQGHLPGSCQLPGRFYRHSSLVAKDVGKG